jgi:hypothetical protein
MPFVGPLLMLISSFSILASLLEANSNLGQFAYSNLLPHVNAARHSTSRSTPCPQSMNPGPLTSPPPARATPSKTHLLIVKAGHPLFLNPCQLCLHSPPPPPGRHPPKHQPWHPMPLAQLPGCTTIQQIIPPPAASMATAP